MKKYPQVKLVYPMGQIKILPLDKTIASQQIQDNSTLVLMGMQNFQFSPECKDPGIQVSQPPIGLLVVQQSNLSVLTGINCVVDCSLTMEVLR